jgi:hypothetical protein
LNSEGVDASAGLGSGAFNVSMRVHDNISTKLLQLKCQETERESDIKYQ